LGSYHPSKLMKLFFPEDLKIEKYNDYLIDPIKRQRLRKESKLIAPVGTYPEISKLQNQDVRKGRYTRLETAKISVAIARYLKQKNLAFQTFLKCGRKGTEWKELASCISDRAQKSIFDHFTRRFLEYRHGKWDDEELEKLFGLIQIHGQKWEKISRSLGRSPYKCLKKFSQLGNFVTGHFRPEETRNLLAAIRDLCGLPASATLDDMAGKKIPWKAVTERVGTRNRDTLYVKFWSLVRSRHRKSRFQKWSEMFASSKLASLQRDIELLKVIQQTGAESESEIDTASLQDYHYNGRLRLSNLKRACPAGLTFSEQINFLVEDRERELKELKFQATLTSLGEHSDSNFSM